MTKEVLQKYILNRIKDGDEFSEIKQDLTLRGYSEAEIDEAYSTGKPVEKPLVLRVNEKAIEKKEFSLDWLKKIMKYKKYFVYIGIAFVFLLIYEYLKKMPLETISRSIIVGSVYFLMLLVVLITKGIIIYNSIVASRNAEMQGILKKVIYLLIIADFIMLFIIPFSIQVSIWIPVVSGTIIFLLLCMVSLDLNIHETIISGVTYALLNFLILFLITKTTTPQFILKFFLG